MSPRLWLDTDFTHHTKLIALGDPARRWAWLEVLVYTCRMGSAHVPARIRDVVPKANARFLKDCERLKLLDRRADGELYVHDWDRFQGTLEERIAAYLLEHPDASANEVQQAVAGRRDRVQAIMRDRSRTVPGWSPDWFPDGPGFGQQPAMSDSDSDSELEAFAPLSETQSPPSYEGGRDFTTLGKLKHACRAHVGSSDKLDRAARGCSEADVVAALEACKGPGVRDRLAVALAELKRRKETAA